MQAPGAGRVPGLLGRAKGEGGSCSSGIPRACPHDPSLGTITDAKRSGGGCKAGGDLVSGLVCAAQGVGGAFVSGTVD